MWVNPSKTSQKEPRSADLPSKTCRRMRNNRWLSFYIATLGDSLFYCIIVATDNWIQVSTIIDAKLKLRTEKFSCYGMNVGVPSKFMLSPNPQNAGIYRWDLWELALSEVLKVGPWSNGITALIRRNTKS